MTESAEPAPDPPDPLVAELRAEIPRFTRVILTETDVTTVLEQVESEAAREEVVRDVIDRVLDESDDILRITNPEISDLREAESAVAAHRQPQAGLRLASRWSIWRGQTLLGLGLSLSLAYPVLLWQLWSRLSTDLGPVLASSIFGVLAGTVVVLVHLWVGSAGRQLVGSRLPAGSLWALAVGGIGGLLLAVWQTGLPSGVNIVPFVILATVVSGGINEYWDDRSADEKTVIRRALIILIAAVVSSIVTWQILQSELEWRRVAYSAGTVLVIAVGVGPALTALWTRRRVWIAGADWVQAHAVMEKERDSARDSWRGAAERVVRQAVVRQVNEAVRPAFTTVLGELDRSGLGQMRPGDRVVSTSAFAELRKLTEAITGGAVGMAGPRGAGKSTLLEAYELGKFLAPGQEHIAVFENVPVRYDTREFTLHLYARTCDEVIRFCNRRLTEAPSGWPMVVAWSRRLLPAPVIVLAWLGVGYVGARLINGQAADLVGLARRLWWPVVVGLAIATPMFLLWRRRRGIGRVPVSPELAANDLATLRALAREKIAGIQFQQKHTSGWSGKVGLLGAEGGLSGSQELTRLPMTYPQLVHEFSEFLETTIACVTRLSNVSSPAVVIVLDELDKIFSPEQALAFVNEVKALFNLDVPGFLFLVSVSEDALAAFERRGMPLRDAFDSAFDEIFLVEYLKLNDARAMLGSRILRLPEPFVCLIHCLAGGLPRELVRVARQVTGRTGTLAEICREVVAMDLRGKVAALRTVVARRTYDETAASELMRRIDAHATADPAVLLGALDDPPVLPRGRQTADLRPLLLESLGYLYFAATVLETFGDDFTEEDMVKGRDTDGDASFDTLTSVRQLFSLNARLAWLTVSAFREARGLATKEPP